MPITKTQALTGLAFGATCLVTAAAIALPLAMRTATINSTEDARAALIDEHDLPSEWHAESQPAETDATTTFTTGALSPASCADAWRALDDTNDAWAAAPVDVRITFASTTSDAYLTEQITHDGDLDPDEFIADLGKMADACSNYTYILDDGTTNQGTVVLSDLGQGDGGVGIEQTWIGRGEVASTTYFAYVPSGHTIITLKGVSVAPGSLTPEEFTTAVHAARAAIGVR
jgi:hypothetical protein